MSVDVRGLVVNGPHRGERFDLDAYHVRIADEAEEVFRWGQTMPEFVKLSWSVYVRRLYHRSRGRGVVPVFVLEGSP